MAVYKLMVVSPFEKYKRGDYIYEQEFVEKILDPNSPFHEYNNKVRKILLSENEKKVYGKPEKVKSGDAHEKPLRIESIKDDGNKSSKPYRRI
ncbi:hypothetical protein AQUSIP_12940 [Aquicella siphonis]|uniref:Uncharacterized protein n=1 Tax=Aquicella siphonis TaxID=254247 RepID=A0A5E4PHY5_9COXI|nr:hypothetical protein [Aquicella siphonis]VVC75993.1 hypothetical protein AQUSIP_12940 [Aquicella siphonis]